MESVSFKLSYSALKLFGKQLYSNVGAAISELVANGLDANADDVYISINKARKTVEVYDDGDGMSESDIAERYCKIGYNKRNDQPEAKNGVTMGRKGIGKLAALYLSDKYMIITKKEEEEPICMELDVSGLSDDESPQLNPCALSSDVTAGIENYATLLEKGKGTIVFLYDVDFDRVGQTLFESIKQKISTVFLYSELAQHVYMKLTLNEGDVAEYKEIERRIAYKNLAFVFTSEEALVSECIDNHFSIPSRDKKNNSLPSSFLTEINLFGDSGFETNDSIEMQGRQYRYNLEGWIGIHSTINVSEATFNDDRYIRNQMYSPNQLRLYVRKKLAVPNMLDYLNLTAAFANYIEGDIAFDILDYDELPDIATAGRQDFDTTDPRFVKLVDLLRSICSALIRKRQNLADQIKENERRANDNITANAKHIFNDKLKSHLDSYDSIPKRVKDSIQFFTSAQIKGNLDVELKTDYSLFLSHSSNDKHFTDFIYYYLLKKGISEDEIFYTSGQPDTSSYDSLSSRIKSWIIDKNNDILFVVSGHFNTSQYCLFEGGAAWATRSEEQYKIISLESYQMIPDYLTNGKKEAVLNFSTDNWELDRSRYSYIREVLLRIVEHLNKNRSVANKPLIVLDLIESLPDDVTLSREGKTIQDYLDEDLCSYWNTYVKAYIEQKKKEQEEREKK